jgi:hypothetical protein
VVASKKNKWYVADPAAMLRTDDHHFKELIVFATEEDALAAGFHSRRASTEPKPPQRAGSKM